ncbi:GumC family protein [Catalinimonas niigatensis]|uniref:GumC family protein n=1 Tax=Catalinimonas niigatensis TaxID=1397264 RepID=UPI002665CE4D|nr:polysaccharide biosynthesis tyrosine autokinase [Catalinimonas niigatensis]WPP50272.1 polysaccharide biosynthesis tyrosine autokinase [Catalinimonas niigatensis]
MEQNQNNHQNEGIDVFTLLSKIASKWYLFVLSIGLFVYAAYIYNTYTEKFHEIGASIYVKGTAIGSKEAGEIVNDDLTDEGVTLALSNEIGKLTSYSLIKSALEELDFGKTYYHVESFWPEFIREFWLKEITSFPFEVKLDSSANQSVNTPIYIKAISDSKFQVHIVDDEANILNFETNKGRKVYDLDYKAEGEFGKPFQSDYANFIVNMSEDFVASADFNYSFKLSRIEDLAMEYQQKLSVLPLDEKDVENRILQLLINSSIADKGVNFLNTLIDVYSYQGLSKKNTQGQNSVEFLDKQIAVLADSLRKAELALQSFKSSSSILDIDIAKGSVIGNLNDLQQQKAMLETKLRYYRSTLKHMNDNENSDRIIAPSSAGINEDPLFNQLIQKYIELNTRLRELSFTAQPDNPLVIQLKNQAESTRDAIVDGISSSIETQSANLESINNRIYALKNSINTLPQDERRLTILQREYDNYAVKYNNLLEKKASAEMSLATNADNVEVVDSAKKTGYIPVIPNLPLNYALAFVLGFIFPLGYVLVKDLTNNNITDKKELERQTKVPLLGMIANGPKGIKIVSKKYPNSAIAESFKFARINLQYFHQSSNDKVIGVTSSISGEGKTFCSANLAATFAESGKRTLLICGDLRKPKIQDFFDLRGPGLTDYVNDFVTLDNIIQPTEFRNLDVIAPGIPQEDPIKLFESLNMGTMFKNLRERYDHIVVETPPIGYVADYFVLLKHFDINLFVVRYNYTNKNILSGINDLYANNKIQNLYLLFNDVKQSAEQGYGYLSNSEGYYTSTKSSIKKLSTGKGKIKNPFV